MGMLWLGPGLNSESEVHNLIVFCTANLPVAMRLLQVYITNSIVLLPTSYHLHGSLFHNTSQEMFAAALRSNSLSDTFIPILSMLAS